MSRKLLIVALVLLVVLVIAVALNGVRLYSWLLALHGGSTGH